MTKVNVAECWLQIEQWLAAHVPVAVSMLPPGVSSSAVAQARFRSVI